METMLTNDMIYALPLILAAAAMLLLPTPLTPHARTGSAVVLLAVLLLSGFLCLVLSAGAVVTTNDAVVITLAMLASALTAAPLLDRARPTGLMIAAPLCGFAVLSASFYNDSIPSASLLDMLVVAAVAAGLGGSVVLPLHPSRHTAEGTLRSQTLSGGILLSGWALLAVVLAALAHMLAPTLAILPMVLCAIVAALSALLTARTEDALANAGQGLAAGVMIAAIAPLSLEVAAILGIVAGFLVARSPAITNALRFDDPHQLTGTLLLPAILGLLMPGILTLDLLAQQLVWLGFALTVGGSIAVIVWPLTMLFFGVALPPQLMRAGLPAR